MNIETHRHHYFNDLQISSQDFYQLIEDTINSRNYPDVTCKRKDIAEGGMFSDKREYLIVSRKRNRYVICAAPFGTSFFISYWLQETDSLGAQVAAKLPVIGQAMAKRAETKTLFQWDTELLFKESISGVIEDAVRQLAASKGHRQIQETVVN